MTTRMKALLGASVLALLSGAMPAVLAPAAEAIGQSALADLMMSQAEAQESGEEGGDASECTTDEDGEGEEAGATECPTTDEGSGEEGEDGEGG